MNFEDFKDFEKDQRFLAARAVLLEISKRFQVRTSQESFKRFH